VIHPCDRIRLRPEPVERKIITRWFAAVLTMGSVYAAETATTFHKDVEPILQRSCQTCHRPGQVAPMSFLTYESTRPWAKAVKAAVLARKMPPWFADPKVGHFLNDRSLKQGDLDTIAKWADSGAPEGEAKDAPAPIDWPEGWMISRTSSSKAPQLKFRRVPRTM
jgi:hypothetical protein